MLIQVGFVSTNTGKKQAYKQEYDNADDANKSIAQIIKRAMEIGWMPTYVLKDGVQVMKPIGDDVYTITI